MRRKGQPIDISTRLDLMACVRTSQVILIHLERPPVAVALRYNQEVDDAPRIAAVAWSPDAIISMMDEAHERRVPIVERFRLTRCLAELEVGAEVPSWTYRSVARVIAKVLSWKRAGIPFFLDTIPQNGTKFKS